MTDEEKDEVLFETGEKLKKVYPKHQGFIKFNLKPGRPDVNVNVLESKLLKKRKTHA